MPFANILLRISAPISLNEIGMELLFSFPLVSSSFGIKIVVDSGSVLLLFPLTETAPPQHLHGFPLISFRSQLLCYLGEAFLASLLKITSRHLSLTSQPPRPALPPLQKLPLPGTLYTLHMW